jgi:hypothetical protein
LKKYQLNNLLYSGTAIFCCAFIILLVINITNPIALNKTSRFNLETGYGFLIIMTLFIAPLFEELIFRGYFTNNKFLKLLLFIGIPIYALISNNNHLFVFIIPYFIILILQNFKLIKVNNYFVYISNATIFSLVHYKISDFSSFYTILPMFTQFGIGLILIWVVLNFGILKSILLHFSYNLLLILILMVQVQFPDEKLNSLTYDGFVIIWQKTPVFSNVNSTLIKPNEYEIECKNMGLYNFYKTFSINKDSKNLSITPENEMFHFNVKIYSSTKRKLNSEIVKKLLTKAKLIVNNEKK